MGKLKNIQPLELPRDTRGLMQFDPAIAARIDRMIRDAEASGCWEVPEDVPIELRSERFWAYWIYKTAYPITSALRGSGVERALEPYRRNRFDLLAPGFEVDREWILSASGDLMCTRGLESARDRLFAEVSDLVFDVDIAYANLESTLTTGPIKPMAFSMEEAPSINVTLDQYRTLVGHGSRRFDVLQLANNHILDCGEEGVRTTLAQLASDGIEQVGVNPSAEAARVPRETEHDGLRIGWVAHTFSVNFKPFPADKPWIVNMTPFHLQPDPDTSVIEEQIRACREEGCDLVIVSLHWGLEFECLPHPHQREWAQRFAKAGADVVIGHHPHVVQGAEIFKVPGAFERQVPIIYSLGNLTPVLSHPATVLSLVARLRLVKGRQAGIAKAAVAAMDLTPVVAVADGNGSPTVVRLNDLYPQLHREPLQAYLAEVASYADLVLGESWRVRAGAA